MTDSEREKWLEDRRRGIGSSDAAAILRLSPHRTPLHVYLEKVGEWQQPDSEEMLWGRVLEPAVAQVYQERTGRQVLPPQLPIMQHGQYPWMLASLDRVVQVGEQLCPLEIKTAGHKDREWGEPGTDVVPRHYLIQVQHQLAVSGAPAAELAVLFAGQRLEVYHLPRSDEIIQHLLVVEGDFWRKVIAQEPPEMDWEHPLTLDLVRKLHGLDEGTRIELGEEALFFVDEMDEAQRHIREWENKKRAAQAQLLHRMGDAAVARLPLGYELIRQRVKRRGFEVPPSEYVTLRVRKPRGSE